LETILQTLPFLSDLLDCIPSNIFVFDKDLRVVYSNRASSDLTGKEPKATFQKLCGESLNCLNSLSDGLECGKTAFCNDCVLRNSIIKAFNGEKSFRINTNLKIVRNDKTTKTSLKISSFPLLNLELNGLFFSDYLGQACFFPRCLDRAGQPGSVFSG